MKYKMLLTGKNNTVINDFFALFNENIEALTTSTRYDDIIAHLKYFEPDAFCYCISNEAQENINMMVTLKRKLEQNKIPLVVIGNEENCNEFERLVPNIADLVLIKSIKASGLQGKIIKYIEKQRFQERQAQEEEQQRIMEEVRLMQEQLEKEQRKHILVIDDSSEMLKMIKEQLRDAYDVATAISGKIAIKFLEKKKTDLILLDYEMPGENGPEVLEKLRANDATKNIPVIFLTGVKERDKIQQVLAMKPQGYLLKPIEHEKLINTIKSIFSGGVQQ